MSSAQVESPRWSAADLYRFIDELNPNVAVFDCDGTLWSGDAGYGFMVWSIEQGLVSRTASDWIDTRHRGYMAGKVSELEICGEMVQVYAGLREHELRAAAAEYVSTHVLHRVFDEMAALIARLRTNDTTLWAVSSTNNWVIAEGVRQFGIPEERILAAQVQVEDGVITSTLIDVPTDEGKAASLRRAGLPHPDAVFGNSIHDLAMLEIARKAFPTNPSPALLEACIRNGWGYFRPAAAEDIPAAVAGE
ncbi:MAG TPA: haloacid dehalogenase-like hydrolase [Acidobacteriaceae bacterium]|nr:haloacid dehalogenase-like hydrolase [Acidobacteriaceae bacterium]